MNAHRALKEARKRWGRDGFVLERDGAFRVGIQQGKLFHVAGVGSSWNKAFANADKQEAKHGREEAQHAVADAAPDAG